MVKDTKNCSLDGNQSMVVGNVLVQTWGSSLVKETLKIKVGSNIFHVRIIDEVRDIVAMQIEEEVESEWEEEDDSMSEKSWSSEEGGDVNMLSASNGRNIVGDQGSPFEKDSTEFNVNDGDFTINDKKEIIPDVKKAAGEAHELMNCGG